jgi:peptidoglycan/LPS O-acetylase OafA/YrhL
MTPTPNPELSVAPPLDGAAAPVKLSSLRSRVSLERVDLNLSRNASLRLDALRAVAALIVMVGHVRKLFFTPPWQLGHPGAGTQALYDVTDLGHSAVMIFFVLSGFLITLSILRAIVRGRWSWSWYLSQRLTRLWVVLIPALLLGAAWDQMGIHLFGVARVYDHPSLYGDVLGYAVPARSNPAVFLGNVAFLQDIVTTPFGSNGPLWSLSFEWWYYLIFPCLLFALLLKTLRFRIALLIVAAALIVFIGRELIDFPVWLLGAFVIFLPRPQITSRSARAVFTAGGLLIAFVSLFAYRFMAFTHHVAVGDFVNGLGAATGLYLLVIAASPAKAHDADDPGLVARLATASAGFSYTLYLVHLPALIFLRAALSDAGVGQWQADGPHLLLGGMIAAAVLLYAWLISRVTEARTADVRLKLTNLVGIPAVPGAATSDALPSPHVSPETDMSEPPPASPYAQHEPTST